MLRLRLGASAPEVLVEDVVNYLRQNGFSSVEEVEVMPENVRFGLPPEIIQAIGSAGVGGDGARVTKQGIGNRERKAVTRGTKGLGTAS
jgi:hypothetical protein